ncbi:MAG: Foldase protein PrsA 1 [Myxococcota bacterium]|nr:Foldase protein PrsA 1 [Myxococcota bacterium]
MPGLSVTRGTWGRAALLAALLAGCTPDPAPVEKPPPSIRINNRVIPAAVVESEWRSLVTGIPGGAIAEPAAEKVRRDFVERFIDRQLLVGEAMKRGVKVEQSDLDNAAWILGAGYPDEKDLQAHMKARGVVPQQIREGVRERLLVHHLLHKDVFARVLVTDAEIAAYYEQNSAEFQRPERVHALQIVVKNESDAQDLRRRIMKGEPFEELARQFSTGPEAERGGDLGTFARGVMPPVFDEACFALRKGGVSPVFPSDHGFHIFKVADRYPEFKPGLDQVKEKIRTKLRRRKELQAEKELLDSLRRTASITVDPEVLSRLK